jgi:hypothetical protein
MTNERTQMDLYEEEISERDFDTSENKDESLLVQAANFVFERGAETVRKYISRMPINSNYIFDSGYALVRDVVEAVVSGDIKYDIKEVSRVRGDNLGYHIDGNIEVLDEFEIPGRVFGSKYLDVLTMAEKDSATFNSNVQAYIKLHEIAEMEYMNTFGIRLLDNDSHGKYEAYLLKSFEDLGLYDVLEAAVAVHSMRDNGDNFLECTKKYLPELGTWIDGFLEGKSEYQFPGMNGSYDNVRWN